MRYQEFTIKQGDLRPALVATCKDADGKLVNITDATKVVFRMKKRGDTKLKVDSSDTRDAMIQQPIEGEEDFKHKIQYLWQEGDTDEAGKFEAEFELTFSDGLQTIPNGEPFIVNVVKDTIKNG